MNRGKNEDHYIFYMEIIVPRLEKNIKQTKKKFIIFSAIFSHFLIIIIIYFSTHSKATHDVKKRFKKNLYLFLHYATHLKIPKSVLNWKLEIRHISYLFSENATYMEVINQKFSYLFNFLIFCGWYVEKEIKNYSN